MTTGIYRRLPPAARSVAASARGLQLQLRRYDRGLERRVQGVIERDYWSPEEWADYREERLELILAAAEHCSYYQPLLDSRSTRGLCGMEITPKAAVRDDTEAFLTSAVDHRRLVSESTSGTSGTPLTLKFTKTAVNEWFALVEARMRRWHGLSVTDRWAMFGGQVVVPVHMTDPPFWVHNWPMHQLYMSTHHISRRNTPEMARALRRFAPRYLLGYPSSMALLARFALEESVPLPKVDVVLSNAEQLTPAQREVITLAFGAPVRNTYGMAEAAGGGSECEHGTMHAWPEAGIIEVKTPDGGVSSEPGAEGPLLLTGLLNDAMPLIRYEVGDRGSVPTPSDCRCGRTLPILGEIQGRSTDFLVAPDGRHVFWINPVFKGLPVEEAQVVQHTATDVEVRIVAKHEWTPDSVAALTERLGERLGTQVAIRIVEVDHIERDPSGKFRSVVSHVEGD